MLLTNLRRRSSQTLLATALGLGLATPAAGETLYRYKTAEGHWAYADELKRVPERYRKQAKSEATGSLSTYSRYTPTDSEGAQSRADELAARLERLRALNASFEGRESTGTTMGGAYATDGQVPFVRVGPDNGAPVYVPTAGDDGEPVIVEQKRYRVAGSAVTRHNTIVRQGDRVIAVYKPRTHVTTTTDIRDESVFDRR